MRCLRVVLWYALALAVGLPLLALVMVILALLGVVQGNEGNRHENI